MSKSTYLSWYIEKYFLVPKVLKLNCACRQIKLGQSSLCCQLCIHTQHKHTHKAVQSWQAQQDRAFFLFIIYSPTQHTLASTSYRANIYSQHSSISLTKLFLSSMPVHCAMFRTYWFQNPVLGAGILWSGQILLRVGTGVIKYMHAWTLLCMNEQDGVMNFTLLPLNNLICKPQTKNIVVLRH